MPFLSLAGPLSAAVAEDEGDHSHYQEDHEKYLGDARRPSGDAAKTENRSDQRNDKKNKGVMQHGGLLCQAEQRRRCRFRLVVNATPIAAMDSVYEALGRLPVGQVRWLR